jgi:hypothetical protein
MDQSDDRPNIEPTQVDFSNKAMKIKLAPELTKDLETYHSIDAEKELTAFLTAALKEEIKKEEKINPPSLEERIARMKKMLESTLPTVLEQAIHKNILSLMEKKIKRDHCE